jgi:hypothetical protein
MERSAVARGRGPATAAVSVCTTVLCAFMFAWPALFNGYPLIFNDSGRYIDGGIRHFIPSEAPIFYGIFMIPLHLNGFSLWPVVIAQCLILAYVLRVTLRVLDLFDERAYLALCAFLAICTGAPWFASLIMPDVFAAILVLSLFVLYRGWEKLGLAERFFFIGLALVALSTHVTHIVVGLSLAALFLLLSWLRRLPKTPAIVIAALPLVGLSALLGINLVAKGRPIVTADGNVFLFARVFSDGPGYEYMRDHCGEGGWRLCDIYTTLSHNSDDILWAPEGSVWSVDAPRDEVRREAAAIVRGAILAHPGEVLGDALRNTVAQLMTFRAGVDFVTTPGSWGALAVYTYFPREFGQFARSRQQADRLNASLANRLYTFVVVASLVGALLMLGLARFDPSLAEFFLVIGGALLANAVATGVFSSVHHRYQARTVWLIPFAFAISILVYRCRRYARYAPLTNEAVEGKA